MKAAITIALALIGNQIHGQDADTIPVNSKVGIGLHCVSTTTLYGVWRYDTPTFLSVIPAYPGGFYGTYRESFAPRLSYRGILHFSKHSISRLGKGFYTYYGGGLEWVFNKRQKWQASLNLDLLHTLSKWDGTGQNSYYKTLQQNIGISPSLVVDFDIGDRWQLTTDLGAIWEFPFYRRISGIPVDWNKVEGFPTNGRFPGISLTYKIR